MSNTRQLAEAGWSGVCVEPAVTPFRSLMRNYKGFGEISLVHAAIMPRRGLSVFWDTADALSTFDAKHMRKWQVGSGVPFNEIWTAHVTFADLFAVLPGPYDFISIDAEGNSVALLESLDPMRVGARMISVEHDDRLADIATWATAYGFRQIGRTEENVLLGK